MPDRQRREGLFRLKTEGLLIGSVDLQSARVSAD
jgi:hypothetical protein